ncbi:hypothetical protein ACTNCH_03465 [Candidatus Merdisoma sp. HCP28S3_D10]|uniref:hypothetical protein n=1 Tax=unclassified Candidatus Merdisoma TaxID=3099611 RepID=UPI003F8916AB
MESAEKERYKEQEKVLLLNLDKGIDDLEQERVYSHAEVMEYIRGRMKKEKEDAKINC